MTRGRRLLYAACGFLVLMLAEQADCQTKNRRDVAGRKQGYWEATDARGGLVYSGHFKDDRPVGLLKRYYPTGELRVLMNHDPDGRTTRVTFLRPDGTVVARGNYTGTAHDSTWVYYHSTTGNLLHRVEYRNGQRVGVAKSFYPDGKTADETTWKADVKEGQWNQYFNSGQLKSAATYLNNRLNGAFTVYFPDGTKQMEGRYVDDLPDGDWKRYDEGGNVVSLIRYAAGEIINKEEVEAAEQEYFRRVTEQEGRIREPTVEDMMREAENRP